MGILMVLAGSTAISFDMSMLGAPGCAAASAVGEPCASVPDPSTGSIIPVRINGVAGRMLIDPGATGEPICNPGFARRANIRAGEVREVALVGPVGVRAALSTVAVHYAGGRVTTQVSWTVKQSVTNADCVAGPAFLKEDMVTFQIAPVREGMVTASWPFLPVSDSETLSFAHPGVSQTVRVRFSFRNKVTVTTAPAALVIAPGLGGTIDGPARSARVEYGIYRPVRRMFVKRPLRIGPLSTNVVYVRIVDWGKADKIRSNIATMEEDDIVVMGKTIRRSGYKKIMVGWQDIANCASLSFDKSANMVVLTC